MQIVIIGGGDISWALTRALLDDKHKVTVIEKDPAICRAMANMLNTVVINGDGTLMSTLQDAKLEDADIFIALTGRDQDNLVACQVASKRFNVSRTVARVKQSQNKEIFEKLGVTRAINTTSIISDIVKDETLQKSVRTVARLVEKDAVIMEIEVEQKSGAANSAVKDLEMPGGSDILAIFRDAEVLFPDESTVLKPGDRALAFVHVKDKTGLINLLTGEAASS